MDEPEPSVDKSSRRKKPSVEQAATPEQFGPATRAPEGKTKKNKQKWKSQSHPYRRAADAKNHQLNMQQHQRQGGASD